MIHTILELQRPLFILDTETTGTNTRTDRVIEIGFQQWTAEGLVKEWRTLVNPGVPIPPASTRVHGITDAMVSHCRYCEQPQIAHPTKRGEDVCEEFTPWPRFTQLAANLAKGLTNCDFGGQRIRFDLGILAAEMERVRQPWDYSRARVIDTLRLEGLLAPRNLGALHEKYTGMPHDGAHGALSDVRAATTVLAMQLDKHPNLPRDLDKLHALQWPDFIDTEGKFVFTDGVAHFGGWGKYANKPMSAADNGYWNFILSNDFPADVKRLAADAKLGKYPTKGGSDG